MNLKEDAPLQRMWVLNCRWNDRIRKSPLCKDQERLLKLTDWKLLGDKMISWCQTSLQGISLRSIQTVHAVQYKKKQSNEKLGKRLK